MAGAGTTLPSDGRHVAIPVSQGGRLEEQVGAWIEAAAFGWSAPSLIALNRRPVVDGVPREAECPAERDWGATGIPLRGSDAPSAYHLRKDSLTQQGLSRTDRQLIYPVELRVVRAVGERNVLVQAPVVSILGRLVRGTAARIVGGILGVVEHLGKPVRRIDHQSMSESPRDLYDRGIVKGRIEAITLEQVYCFSVSLKVDKPI